MSAEQMREEFEAAAAEQLMCSTERVYGERAEQVGLEDGDYFHLSARMAWHWWQASRAALVVELPAGPATCDMTSTAICDAISECRAAIEAAGVKVK